MAIFNYSAVTKSGSARNGVMEGDSISHVRLNLMSHGLIPLKIIPAKRVTNTTEPTSKWNYFFERKKSVSVSHLAVITYQFAALLGSGMPVETALGTIVTEMENNYFKRTIIGVRSKVLEGHTLAMGMADYPNVFPKLYIASVAVGEKTGQLDNVLNNLAEYYEKQRQVQGKIIQAVIYPALLTLVSCGIVVFLLVYVIPQIAKVFKQTGQELPSLTIHLLQISGGLRDYGLYIIGVLFFLIAGFMFGMKRETFRYRFHQFLLKIPIINNTILAINAARFSRTFGTLFAAGVPVLDAMASANSVVSLLPMREAIKQATVQVGEGTSIHQALQKTGYFSSLSNQLIASGEASGDLETMLQKAASFQEQSTANKITTALSVFEPILILTMGFVVLLIVLAVLLPIFNMNDLVK